MHEQETIEMIHALDWYDGIVAAQVAISHSEERYLAVLLSLSLELRRRALGLVSITPEEWTSLVGLGGAEMEARIRSLFEGDREAIVAVVDDATLRILSTVNTRSEVIAAEIKLDSGDAIQSVRWLEN